jgi:hypothetical protein
VWDLIVGLLMLPVVLVGLGAMAVREDASRQRYRNDVATWAGARGWRFYKGAGGRTWTSPLPRVSASEIKSQVELQVDGIRDGYQFTLVYAIVTIRCYNKTGLPTMDIGSTAVIVRLPSAYPTVEIKPKKLKFLPVNGGIGHAAFDKKFRVHTSAPGGPAAIVCTQLAEAHVAGEVPLWSLREQELMCPVRGEIRIKDLDSTLDRAVRVAKLLSIAPSRAGSATRKPRTAVLAGCYDPGMERGRDAHVRISQAERDQAISMLGVHLSTGRLELAEFEDRCGKAATSLTRAEVELLFGDLPLPHPDLSLAARPTAPNQVPGQGADRNVSSKSTTELTETPLSSAMEVIAGLTLLFGIPGAIALTIWQGMWWTFLPVLGTMILAGGLSEGLKKPKQH